MDGPIRQTVVAAALLLLGVFAAVGIDLGYAPSVSFPEISVALNLPGRGDPAEITRRWVVPIETAVRGLGQVREIVGDVHQSGAWLRVRLAPGTDPERKAARLGSDLDTLRRGLPDGAGLNVWPASESGDDRVMVLWLSGLTEHDSGRFEREVSERLRDVRGVRDVAAYGSSSPELLVRMRPGASAGAAGRERIRRTIADQVGVNRIGSVDRAGRRIPLVAGSPAAGIAETPVRQGNAVLPLAAVAELIPAVARPHNLSRYRGTDGIALLVYKDDAASLLTVDRRLRRAIRGLAGRFGDRASLTVIRADADPLLRLLWRLGLGLGLAALALGLAGLARSGLPGGLRLLAVIPLSLAIGLNLFRVFDVSLNVVTLLAWVLALGAVLPFATLRLLNASVTRWAPGGGLLFCGAALLPLGIALAGPSLSPLLGEPARAFLLGTLAGLPVPHLLRSEKRPLRLRFAESRLRALLRASPTVALLAGTLLFALFAVFGSSLDPRSASPSPDRSRLVIRASYPQGTPLEETGRYVRDIERRLATFDAIESTWSLIRPAEATLLVQLAPSHRGEDRVRQLRTQLAYRLPPGVRSISSGFGTGEGASMGEGGFAGDLRERPDLTRDFRIYRVVLRGSREAALREAFRRISDTAVSLQVPADSVRPERAAPSLYVELAPRPGTTPAQAAELAALLRDKSEPSRAVELFDVAGGAARVTAPGDLGDRLDVPRKSALLNAPLQGADGLVVAAALADVRERIVYPTLGREAGRFVLPVRILFAQFNAELREQQLRDVDRNLATLKLPEGCDLERPSLEVDRLSSEDWRLLGLAVLFPAILFLLATIHRNSFVLGLCSLVPGAAGLAAATPWLAYAASGVDEMTLFALAAVQCATLPAALWILGASERDARGVVPRAIYRAQREAFPGLLVGALVLALLYGGSSVGADRHEDSWALPLQVAALSGATSLAVTALVAPPLLLLIAAARTRDRVETRRRQHPAAWRDPGGSASLTTVNLTKIYASNVRALYGVSFRLDEGIVGLLGPNGAGKTTLLRLVTGLLEPTRGRVAFRGVDVRPDNRPAFRRHMGFLPQDFNAYEGFSARQYLDFWALERGFVNRAERRAEVERLLREVDLADEAERKVRQYSGGMRRRIGIAMALIGSPSILILDEPTTGLDVESRMRLRETLLGIAPGRLIVLSTHIAGDVSAIASRLLVLHRGRLLFDGKPSELIARAAGRVFETLLHDDQIRSFGKIHRITSRVRTLQGNRVRAIAPSGAARPGTEVPPKLDEAYLAEIDRADAKAGRGRREDRFAFLSEGRRPPSKV